MSITYTNRKGRKYYLCQGVTKTGKPRYYFSREQKGEPVNEIPDGFEITESVNGIVSLSRIRPKLLLESEIELVESALEKHPETKRYRLDVKSKVITIYEQVGPDFQDLAMKFRETFGLSSAMTDDFRQAIEKEQKVYTQYTPIMKFILSDEEKRLFRAQRMCYLGSIDDWIDIEYNETIDELASTLIPTLGTDEFFELH